MKWPFKRKLKSYLLEKKYRVVEAFKLGGKSYFMFDDAFQMPTGRGLAWLTINEEMQMRCTQEYLEIHCKAIEILLSDPKKINILAIAQIHNNLRERLSLTPFPDQIYKLASIIFFDETESPYAYDQAYNQKKIAIWKNGEGTLDFFLKTKLTELIPSLNISGENVETYFQVSEQIDKAHRSELHHILSKLQ